MELLIYHVIFAIVEYLILLLITNFINIINYDFVTLKYSTFRFSTKEDSPTGLNMLLKIFFPPIYLVFLSGILYELKYDNLVNNIFFITIIYYGIKWLICNLILNRRILVNWKSEFPCASLATMISFRIYKLFISKTHNIFIPLEELRNGIWMGIITFFFGLIINFIYNQAKLNAEQLKFKTEKYIHKKYTKLKEKYNYIIDEKDKVIELLTYAIMIYEDYNRPYLVRLIEYLKLFITGEATLGIMQVSTKRIINDDESVRIGYERIKESYCSMKKMTQEEKINKTISMYNKGQEYLNEIKGIYEVLKIINKFKNSTAS